MVRIEAPQQHRLQHTKHHRGQVGTPYAARAVVVFAAHHRGAQYPFRRVVVHGHFRTLNKDRKTAPVVVEALQDLMLGTVPVWLVKMALTASLHLAQLALQVKMVLHKSWRLLVHRQRRVPHLESGRIESVEGSDIVDPDPHPVLQLWPTPRRLEKIPPHMRPEIPAMPRFAFHLFKHLPPRFIAMEELFAHLTRVQFRHERLTEPRDPA